MEKTLIILGGANGSGKSTLANVLLQKYPVEFLNADEIAKDYSEAGYSPETAQSLAGREYIKRKKKFFQQNKSFILETTLSGRIILKTLREAKTQGYSIIIVYSFLSSSLDCIQRVKKRVANGGHSVAEEDIARRYFRSIVNFWNECRFLCDRWYLFYNGIDYQTDEIAYGNADKYIIEDNVLFRHFLSIVESAKEKHDVLNVNE